MRHRMKCKNCRKEMRKGRLVLSCGCGSEVCQHCGWSEKHGIDRNFNKMKTKVKKMLSKKGDAK